MFLLLKFPWKSCHCFRWFCEKKIKNIFCQSLWLKKNLNIFLRLFFWGFFFSQTPKVFSAKFFLNVYKWIKHSRNFLTPEIFRSPVTCHDDPWPWIRYWRRYIAWWRVPWRGRILSARECALFSPTTNSNPKRRKLQ